MSECPGRFGQGEWEVERVPVPIPMKSVGRFEGCTEILAYAGREWG